MNTYMLILQLVCSTCPVSCFDIEGSLVNIHSCHCNHFMTTTFRSPSSWFNWDNKSSSFWIHSWASCCRGSHFSPFFFFENCDLLFPSVSLNFWAFANVSPLSSAFYLDWLSCILVFTFLLIRAYSFITCTLFDCVSNHDTNSIGMVGFLSRRYMQRMAFLLWDQWSGK